jgi:hypothetical protein
MGIICCYEAEWFFFFFKVILIISYKSKVPTNME